MSFFKKIFTKEVKKDVPRKIENPDKLLETKKKWLSSEACTQCATPISQNDERLPIATLKKLVPIRELDDTKIHTLKYTTLEYDANAIIFLMGQKTDSVFYLLKGTVEMKPQSEQSYIVNSNMPLANLPLNSGVLYGATAESKSPVTILAVKSASVFRWTNQTRQQVSSSVDLIDIELPAQLPQNQFFDSFADAYRENRLQLPTLPNVALKLKEAMQKDIEIEEAIKIVQVDAAIVAKLIQLSNSAMYAPVSPITNCHDAITRFGLETTRKLVMSISIKQLFTCNNPKLVPFMRALWKNSLYVSSLSFVLAKECCKTVNPEDALLAGLLCDIGIIPVLYFAEQYPEEYSDLRELQSTFPILNPSVGALMLHTLGFSEELVDIPRYAEEWFYETNSDTPKLIDIVILAKLHSYFGSARAKDLPYISTIPAYSKLRAGELNPDFSLKILSDAQERVRTIVNFFN